MEPQRGAPQGRRGWAELIASLLFVLLAVAALNTARVPQGSAAPAVGAAAQPTPRTAGAALPHIPSGSTSTATLPPPMATQQASPTSSAHAEETVITRSVFTSQPMQPTRLLATLIPAQISAERWKDWPVMTVVSEEMRVLYQQGLAEGNNPRAFSVLGDCQSVPDVFLGPYDLDSEMRAALPPELQETIGQFPGMFSRLSPTIKDGSTEGSMLWGAWNDNPEGLCNPGESPLDCELRTNRPSIVFVHVGTHWEARSQRYFSLIIDKILAAKAVPVLVTKADNREKDERINAGYALLAEQYGIPLWNFWAAVQHLPNNGMEPGSDMYLSAEGVAVHREGALTVLNAVWRAVR